MQIVVDGNRSTTVGKLGVMLIMAGGLIARNLSAAGLTLSEPQSGLLVLPKGVERMIHPNVGALSGSAKQPTAAGLSWDDAGLTAVISCSDESVVAAQATAHDNPALWKDDCVDLLLDPGHVHGTPVRVRVSAGNGVADSRGNDASFNIAGLTTRTVRTSQGWRATLFVPWAGLGVAAPKDGDVWGMSIQRIDQEKAFSFDGMQVSAWHPFDTDAQDVLRGVGHVAFVTPATIEDDAKLAAMRETLAAGHTQAVRAWTGPNDGDVLGLGKDGAAVSRLGRIASGTPARQATRVILNREANGLDVRFECEDADIVAVMEGRDNIKLWKDDCVYVWLDPGHIHAATNMIMVQVSAAGVVHDMKNGDAKWNLEGLTAETARTAQGWSAHLKLPWQGLGVAAPRDGDVWGLNLTRMDQPGKAEFRLMEMASLAVIPGKDAGAIHRWGHLVFGVAADVAKLPAHEARRAAVDARLAAEAAAEKAEQAQLAAHWGLPANPNASEDVHKIVAWLAGLRDRKEKRFIVGMADGDPRFKEVFEKSGCWPAMRHFSYTDPVSKYDNEQHPGNNEKTTGDAIATWKDGRLVHIHINPVNPWNGRHIFEPNPLEGREKIAELLQPGNAAHDAWIRKLDAYAKYLAELRDAGVVVLWRPLHEMGFQNMYWYDAGATPDREVFKNLWRQMFRYLTCEKKLDNLIWVFGAGGGPAALDMYPGPEYVDLVGFSLYNAEVNVLNSEYEHLLRFGKPFAFTEFGNWSGPVPGDALDLIRGVREKYPLATFSVHWGSWPGNPASLADSLNVDKLMKHPWVITRENLDWRETKVDIEKSRARGMKRQ